MVRWVPKRMMQQVPSDNGGPLVLWSELHCRPDICLLTVQKALWTPAAWGPRKREMRDTDIQHLCHRSICSLISAANVQRSCPRYAEEKKISTKPREKNQTHGVLTGQMKRSPNRAHSQSEHSQIKSGSQKLWLPLGTLAWVTPSTQRATSERTN